jgi:hypothetical protein
MTLQNETQKAISKFNGLTLEEHQVLVNIARPQHGNRNNLNKRRF